MVDYQYDKNGRLVKAVYVPDVKRSVSREVGKTADAPVAAVPTKKTWRYVNGKATLIEEPDLAAIASKTVGKCKTASGVAGQQVRSHGHGD